MYRQEAGGNFVDVTAESGLVNSGYGMGVAVGDVNNDGYPDLYVTNYHDDQLYLNLGDGRFQNVTVESGIDNPRWGTSACFVDYDRDGDLDLFVTNYVDYYPEKSCYSRRGQQDFCSPIAFPKTVDRLFRNVTGEATEQDPTPRFSSGVRRPRFENVTISSGIAAAAGPGLGVLAADFNEDGWPDFYVANDQDANFLWLNQQDGTFVESALLAGAAYDAQGRPQASMGIAYGDVNQDGRFDLFLTHLQGETNAMYLLDEAHGFADTSLISGLGRPSLSMTGFGTAFADIDHDGDLDLLVTNGRIALPATTQQQDLAENAPVQHAVDPFWQQFAEYNQIYLNDGSGHFEEFRSTTDDFLAACDVSRGLATGDIDNDGDLDFVVSNTGGATRIYRNDAAKNGNGLVVRAVETRDGGRDALGAIVKVHSGGRVWSRLVTTSSSYLSAGDPRVYFGLGAQAAYDRIEVHWPDGSREQFSGGATNTSITLEHGQGESQ